ncbi:MAG: DUF1275 domain-containing protein [Cyclobacteriaceae bacterium]|nr:DUF1275 domain-containing protein [Cyclobacteriaceae bacterium]
MVRREGSKRDHRSNLQIAAVTAIAAGMVNVASIMAFFTFSSNVTGHMAIFSEEIIRGNLHQSIVMFIWLFSFLAGAFTAHFLITKLKKEGNFYANSSTIFVEILILLAVAIYGRLFYLESLIETEVLVGLLLFAMGYQNSLTATITNSVVKTTHLTGLFTDLGMSLSMWSDKINRSNPVLRQKLQLQFTIAGTYFLGGLFGGYIYAVAGFTVFFFVALLMFMPVVYDVFVLIQFKLRHGGLMAYILQLSRKRKLAENRQAQ